jgi:hypothetical protein
VVRAIFCQLPLFGANVQRTALYPAPEQPGIRGKKSEGQPAYGASQLLVAWAEFPDASQALSLPPYVDEAAIPRQRYR